MQLNLNYLNHKARIYETYFQVQDLADSSNLLRTYSDCTWNTFYCKENFWISQENYVAETFRFPNGDLKPALATGRGLPLHNILCTKKLLRLKGGK
jgi:hypothetical protein